MHLTRAKHEQARVGRVLQTGQYSRRYELTSCTGRICQCITGGVFKLETPPVVCSVVRITPTAAVFWYDIYNQTQRAVVEEVGGDVVG